jgi:hypothetical protein
MINKKLREISFIQFIKTLNVFQMFKKIFVHIKQKLLKNTCSKFIQL